LPLDFSILVILIGNAGLDLATKNIDEKFIDVLQKWFKTVCI